MSHAAPRAKKKALATPASKAHRFDARLNRQQKLLIQRAADLEGRSMTDFVLHSAEAAKRGAAWSRVAKGGPSVPGADRREVSGASPYRIEPLKPSRDRTPFGCDVVELDDYFHQRAGRESRRKVAAVFVMLEVTGFLAGYYTLRRSWKHTTEVASVGVVVEARDDSAQAFYRHHEFSPLLEHPGKRFLAMATIEKAFKP